MESAVEVHQELPVHSPNNHFQISITFGTDVQYWSSPSIFESTTSLKYKDKVIITHAQVLPIPYFSWSSEIRSFKCPCFRTHKGLSLFIHYGIRYSVWRGSRSKDMEQESQISSCRPMSPNLTPHASQITAGDYSAAELLGTVSLISRFSVLQDNRFSQTTSIRWWTALSL